MSAMTADDKRELHELVASFVADCTPISRVREIAEGPATGVDSEAWRRLAGELGLVGLTAPESLGGAGGNLAVAAVVIEEFGRALAPLPYLSAVVAIELLAGSGDPQGVLGRLLAGSTTVALAADSAAQVTADANDALTGLAFPVLNAIPGRPLLVRAGTEQRPAWFQTELVPAAVETLQNYDLTRPLAQVRFEGSPAKRLTADPALDARAGQLATVALAVEQVGGASACLAAAVDYAKLREQFGRPIGSFQAVKHRIVDMLVELELTRAVVADAVAAIDAGRPDAELAVAAAAVSSGETYRRLAASNIQVHGGIGYTWELDAQLYFKRAWSSAALFGTAREHLATVDRLSWPQEAK
jgi:alkylation response protein AidB-like acyl-CoA dehydrogenase